MKSIILLLGALACGAATAAEPTMPSGPTTAPAAREDLRALVALMDQRLGLMADVARHKWNNQGAIEDVPRERLIIAALGKQAGEAGLPVAWSEAFFRAQIEAAKTEQRRLFARWRQEQAGPFEGVPDLAREQRPRLDALTPRLLAALTANWAALSDPARQSEVRSAAREGLAVAVWGAAAGQAAAPLTDGSAARP